jgi:hypothetical protein
MTCLVPVLSMYSKAEENGVPHVVQDAGPPAVPVLEGGRVDLAQLGVELPERGG